MSGPAIDLRQRYAMLALTELSLIDDDVDTTPVRAKKRQDHEDERQVVF